MSCGPSGTASDAGCATELRQTAIETRRLPHHDARPPDTHRRHSVSRRPRRNEPQPGRLTRRNSSSTSLRSRADPVLRVAAADREERVGPDLIKKTGW